MTKREVEVLKIGSSLLIHVDDLPFVYNFFPPDHSYSRLADIVYVLINKFGESVSGDISKVRQKFLISEELYQTIGWLCKKILDVPDIVRFIPLEFVQNAGSVEEVARIFKKAEDLVYYEKFRERLGDEHV